MMPKTFADDNQRWDVFREVLTDVRDKLKDMLLIGSDGMAGGEDLHVVPHVTDIYRTYANGIRKVCTIRSVRHGYHRFVSVRLTCFTRSLIEYCFRDFWALRNAEFPAKTKHIKISPFLKEFSGAYSTPVLNFNTNLQKTA